MPLTLDLSASTHRDLTPSQTLTSPPGTPEFQKHFTWPLSPNFSSILSSLHLEALLCRKELRALGGVPERPAEVSPRGGGRAQSLVSSSIPQLPSFPHTREPALPQALQTPLTRLSLHSPKTCSPFLRPFPLAKSVASMCLSPSLVTAAAEGPDHTPTLNCSSQRSPCPPVWGAHALPQPLVLTGSTARRKCSRT